MRPAACVPLMMALLALSAGAAAAAEPCKLSLMGELPVTMAGLQPLVHAAINGTDAVFVADSGAFFSMLTPAAARQFNLQLERPQFGFALQGVGGQAETWVTTVKTFTLLHIDLPRVPFLVAGNDLGNGAVGLLGQNVFRLGDVEYDLANGMIRIMRTHGDCRKASLAYWANAKGLPYSQVDIEFATVEKPHTTGAAYVNGSRIRVVFDTGASTSFLTLEAAKRAGVTPDSPGVTPGGENFGIGRHVVHTWIAPFASFRIGDEEIRNTHLRFGEERLPNTDMLIGADFFLSHHVYVANSQRRLYFTYNGGPVFNLTTTPTPAPSAAGPAAASSAQPVTNPKEPGTTAGAQPGAPAAGQATQPPDSSEPLDAAGYARRGSASASRQDYAHALADLSRAIELAPTEADYFFERGTAYWSNRQPDRALEDFGQAIKLKPDHVKALVARATLHARRNDPAQVIGPDLDAADRAAPKQSEVRLTLGELYQHVRNYPAAIVQYGYWIDSHNRDEVRTPQVRNERCWVRALTGQALERALEDCNAAVRANPKEAAFHDSRGLVYLRQGAYPKAIADYDAALALNPKSAWSLYGRGLARQHLGQASAGQADIATAKAILPKIAEEAASHGIGP
ncbi:MAG: aspartyl protease family protein [Steroidobacteraceae bacterium]